MNKGERNVSEFEKEWINFLVPILNNRDNEIMNSRIRKILDKVEQWHKSERKKWAMKILELIETDAEDIRDDITLDIIAEIRKKIEEG